MIVPARKPPIPTAGRSVKYRSLVSCTVSFARSEITQAPNARMVTQTMEIAAENTSLSMSEEQSQARPNSATDAQRAHGTGSATPCSFQSTTSAARAVSYTHLRAHETPEH